MGVVEGQRGKREIFVLGRGKEGNTNGEGIQSNK